MDLLILKKERIKMYTIANVLRDFSNTVISSWGPILIAVLLVLILAMVFLIGWRVNRPRSYSIGAFQKTLKARYEREEIPKKEYEDIKREIEEPLYQLNYYLKIYG